MRIVLIIAAKNLLLTWRDRLGFFWWMVTFPLLIAVLIGSIFASTLHGPSRPVELGLVDQAHTPDSQEFIKILNAGGGMQLVPMTLEQARNDVRLSKLTGFIELKPGFRISPALMFGERLPVALGVDPAHTTDAAYYAAAAYDAALTLLRKHWLNPAERTEMIDDWVRERHGTMTPMERMSVDIALRTVDRLSGVSATSHPAEATAPATSRIEIIPVMKPGRPKSAFEVCFPLGIVWGLLGLAAEFALMIVREREAGTLLRLRVAPIGRWQILTANGLACFVACLGVMTLLLFVGIVFFGVRLQNIAVLSLAVLCTAAAFVGVTMFLSVLGPTESAVGGAAWAFLLIMAMLGGAMVPQMFLPGWMDTAGDLTFVKWAIRALEGGIWRGFTVQEALRPCAILLAQGALLATVALTIGARTQRT